MRLFLGYMTSVLGVAMTLVEPSLSYKKDASTLILLDIDNTLYREKEAGIEAQIVQNTHSYCQDHLGLDSEKADDLYRAYGSTIEGLRQSLWRDLPKDQLQQELERFYRQVYKDIDMSKLVLSNRSAAGSSTGYSHATDRSIVCRLLQACPYPVCVASNSPSWHIEKVLQAMGLSKLAFQECYTPDRLPFFPTKHAPLDFFGGAMKEEGPSLESYDRLLVLEDSKHNLERIGESFSTAEGVHITSEKSLATALLHGLGLVDPAFDFDQVKYLESKNKVDRQSIHPETWNLVMKELKESVRGDEALRIVDVGAGLLSMLDLFLHGDTENGLSAFVGKKESFPTEYTAYESNRGLQDGCHKRLLSWGFSLQEQVSEEEYIYVHPNIRLRFLLRDYDSNEPEPVAPLHLIIGCCFADLLDPQQLVPSLIRSFQLLETEKTLIYFPITFCGVTQFLPPQPFESGSTSTIPSDTVAFRLYSKALTETLGHNLDSHLLQQAMEAHGAILRAKGVSDWKIDPAAHPYLFDTMLYFFGTAGGPQILDEGWDAPGWIQRAKESRPKIQVSNVDLLFRIGKVKDETTKRGVSEDVFREILFTEPGKVTTNEKKIPKLGPNQVLIESSHSLISSGTELKIFKGMFDDATLDVNIKGMEDDRMAYPLAYGYCLVGRIIQCGHDVPPDDYIGKLAFTFSAHATHVVADVNAVQLVPDGIASEDAIFMPAVETALSLVHDAHVRVGENIAVYGQGLIGLLVTSILHMHSKLPVASGKLLFGSITVFDTIPDRLAAASQMGASQALLPGGFEGLFDVSIEVSGNARALQSAIDHTSSGGRIIVGSWYGNADVKLKLGIEFHRSHKTIQTSQVSEIPASLLGLWNKQRRFALTWELVRQIRPSRLLTKTTTLDKAQMAYEALDKGTEIAVAFDYDQ